MRHYNFHTPRYQINARSIFIFQISFYFSPFSAILTSLKFRISHHLRNCTIRVLLLLSKNLLNPLDGIINKLKCFKILESLTLSTYKQIFQIKFIWMQVSSTFIIIIVNWWLQAIFFGSQPNKNYASCEVEFYCRHNSSQNFQWKKVAEYKSR